MLRAPFLADQNILCRKGQVCGASVTRLIFDHFPPSLFFSSGSLMLSGTSPVPLSDIILVTALGPI